MSVKGRSLTEEEFKQKSYYYKYNGKYKLATHYDENELYYDEPIYDIDLNSRTIDAPEFLQFGDIGPDGTKTIYFCVDRFFDNVDLSTMFCVIQYQNANSNIAQGGYIYPVPYFDI